MRKPSSRLREEIARLQEQLKYAETKEAERIGRIALKAGLGEIELEETDLQAAFENLARHFQAGRLPTAGGKAARQGRAHTGEGETVAPDATAGNAGEA